MSEPQFKPQRLTNFAETEKYFLLSHKIRRTSGAGFHSKHFGEIVPLPCSQCGRYTLREEQDSRTQLETNFSSRRLALVCCPGLSNLIPCYAFSERGQFCQSSMQVQEILFWTFQSQILFALLAPQVLQQSYKSIGVSPVQPPPLKVFLCFNLLQFQFKFDDFQPTKTFFSVKIVKVCHSSALGKEGVEQQGEVPHELSHLPTPQLLPPKGVSNIEKSNHPLCTALNIYSKDFREEEISASDEIPKKWPHLHWRNRLRCEILFAKTFHLRGLLRKVGQQDFQRRG